MAEGDTCVSIAEANNVAYYRLLSDNGIDLQCESLAVGTTLCVGDSCTLHTVRNPSILLRMCFHEADTFAGRGERDLQGHPRQQRLYHHRAAGVESDYSHQV